MEPRYRSNLDRDIPPFGVAFFDLPGRGIGPGPSPEMISADPAFLWAIGRLEYRPRGTVATDLFEDPDVSRRFFELLYRALSDPGGSAGSLVVGESGRRIALRNFKISHRTVASIAGELREENEGIPGDPDLLELLDLVSGIPMSGDFSDRELEAAAEYLLRLSRARAVMIASRDPALYGDRSIVAGDGGIRDYLEAGFDLDRLRWIPGAARRGSVARVGDLSALIDSPGAGGEIALPAEIVDCDSGDGRAAAAVVIVDPLRGKHRVPGIESLCTAVCSALVCVSVRAGIARDAAFYRLFAENLRGIAYMAHPDDPPLFMHGRVREITGYDAEDFLEGRIAWFDLVHPEDRDDLRADDSLTGNIPDRSGDNTYRIVRPDGEIRWVRDVATGIHAEGEDSGEYICGVVQDITEVKMTRDALRSQRLLMRDILENALAGYWDWDMVRDTQYMSPTLKTTLGYDPEELPNTPGAWRSLVHPDDQSRFLARIRRHIQSRGRENLVAEARFLHRDGSVRWMICVGRVLEWDEDDNPLRMGGCHVDVTRRKEMERRLAEEMERYERLTTHAREAIFKLNLDTVEVEYANPAAEAVLGYTLEEYRENPLLLARILHPDSRDEARTVLRKIREGDALPRQVTLGWIHRDGSEVYVEHTVIPVVEPSGEIHCLETIGRDITQQRRNERRLEFLSMYDQLTGLSNRGRFEDELQRLALARADEYPVTLLACDIDGLKVINDSMGHEAGDRLIQETAKVLGRALRRSDLLARVGGDEFAAILLRTPGDEIPRIASRIRRSLEEYNDRNPDLPLSIAVGMATREEPGDSLRETRRRADSLMYRDKLHHRASSKSALVDALLAILATRDDPGEAPAEILGRLSVAIGEAMELPLHALSDLDILARVHDIGKVGVPDDVVRAAAGGGERERSILRQHPEIGFRIASSVPDLAPVAELILKHHERWDGSGYPLGLSGEEIPIQCRISAVAHRYLGILHGSGEGEVDPREALRIVKGESVSAFDPDVVAALVRVLELED